MSVAVNLFRCPLAADSFAAETAAPDKKTGHFDVVLQLFFENSTFFNFLAFLLPGRVKSNQALK